MTRSIEVTIEATPKRTFASAANWPGWSRSGKTEELALEALAASAARYADVASAAGVDFPASVTLADLHLVGRNDGGAGTEFGVPSHPSDRDRRSLDAAGAARLVAIVRASWELFDRTAAAAPRELRKGPRGGGRDTWKIVDHVLDADRAYANELGIKVNQPSADDRRAIEALRTAVLEVLGSARDGEPIAGRRWPARYAAHRIAWHALDHAWEIEDRSS
ncbi:MAG TPA: hypothetical protein VGO64_00150 [Candidatus Limnocylindrales bacterium]|nr:hypothetical protein [Candidatus Limnocylindrales bacterium]